jgi:hypothetical protein
MYIRSFSGLKEQESKSSQVLVMPEFDPGTFVVITGRVEAKAPAIK